MDEESAKENIEISKIIMDKAAYEEQINNLFKELCTLKIVIIIYNNFDDNDENKKIFRNNSLKILGLGLKPELLISGEYQLIPDKELLNVQIDKLIENINTIYDNILVIRNIKKITRDFNLHALEYNIRKDLIDDILSFIKNEDKLYENPKYVKRIKALDSTIYSEIKIKKLQDQVSELLEKERIRLEVYTKTTDLDLKKLGEVFNEGVKEYKKIKKN